MLELLFLQAVSEYEANGLVVARRSHSLHQVISNGSWSRYSASNSGQIRLLEFYQQTLVMMGAFNPHHLLLKTLVNTLESLGLFS